MRPAVPEVAALMAERGLSGKAVAIAAGISTSTFRSIMHRRHDPSRETAEAIALALAVPVESLGLTISGHPFPAHLKLSARKGVTT